MIRLFLGAVLAFQLTTVSCFALDSESTQRQSRGEPNWTYGVVRTGNERDAIKSLPMTDRPYRPLHFYGNTVRRMHYRGTAIPAPRDVVGAAGATVLRK